MSEKTTRYFDFGEALRKLKEGKKVARRGWNGKGMYLWLLPPATIKKEWCRDEKLLECFGESDELYCLGSIRMYTHDSTGRTAVLTGWLTSQSDMLSEDWYEVDELCKLPASNETTQNEASGSYSHIENRFQQVK